MAEVMVKTKVIREFKDREADLVLRKVGQTLTVSQERAIKLENLRLTKRVTEQTEDNTAEKAAAKKTAKALNK